MVELRLVDLNCGCSSPSLSFSLSCSLYFFHRFFALVLFCFLAWHPFVTLRSKSRAHLSPFGHKCNCLERPFVAGLLATILLPTLPLSHSFLLCLSCSRTFNNYLQWKCRQRKISNLNFEIEFIAFCAAPLFYAQVLSSLI